MPIYRAEQARLSFAAEAGHGGYMDIATASDGAAADTVSGAQAAGTRGLVVADETGFTIGDYIRIESATDPKREIRKILQIDATNNVLYLDYPTGFPHDNGVAVQELDAIPPTSIAGNSFVTFLPGVYETITTPDLNTEFLPYYFLSTTANRNFSRMYRGRQSFLGSLPNFVLLNGYALRFPIGGIRTTASVSGYAQAATTSTAATLVGDTEIAVTATTGLSAGDFVEIEETGTNPEVREIIAINALVLTLNYPLMFAHASGVNVREPVASPTYTHTIVENADLDSMTWNLMMRDTGETTANDFIRRYVGGIVNRATLSAEEGGLLMYSWDDVQFLDLVHNQTTSTAVSGELPKASATLIDPTQGNTATESGIGGAIDESGGAYGDADFTTTEPYYFSQGSITAFGVTLARIRNFRLEVNNNVEPRYYIRDQGTDRQPFEIQEQRREYRLTATIAMEDSLSATASTRTLWKELIMEGNVTAGLTVIDMTLVFSRTLGSDDITITIPPSNAADDLEGQGSFIVRAPHNIGADSPVQADVEILTRSISIVIRDTVGVYP